MDFLINNGGTILVGLIIAGIVGVIVVKLVKDKQKGKCVGCDCGCENRECASRAK
ncbi:MAG: FeoB-associated Cys-rich membrane protein [Clostridiales bacterium]|jgi:hypothetical protein|nr:FeoB-associated Cys-rich membrane protein [Clostridiales bacterium]